MFTVKIDKWYAIRRVGDKRWIAYQVPESHIEHLRPGHEYCGPFDSLAKATIAVNENPEIKRS